MNKYRCYLVIIALLAATVCLQPITNAQEENLDSPRLAALAKDIRAGKQDSLTAFWEEMKGKAPLIEPVSGNDKMRWVSYIWRGDGQMSFLLCVNPDICESGVETKSMKATVSLPKQCTLRAARAQATACGAAILSATNLAAQRRYATRLLSFRRIQILESCVRQQRHTCRVAESFHWVRRRRNLRTFRPD
jgi:hypothetical protein